MNQRHCMDWNDVPESVSGAGFGKRMIEGKGMSMVMIRVPAGFAGERHSHPHEQFVQVLSGSGRLETAQGERAFSAGSVFHFPPDAWHRASFDSETVLIETNLEHGS